MSSLTARDRIQLWILDLLSKRGIYLGRRSAKLHVALYRRTRGRIGSRLPGWHQARILLVDHFGAKSGAKRTSPVIYCEHGDAVAVVGSRAGQPTNPAWFHNLKANPDTTIQIGADVRGVRARLASDEERDHLWPKLVATFPAYDIYQRNAKYRKLPVVILDPRRPDRRARRTGPLIVAEGRGAPEHPLSRAKPRAAGSVPQTAAGHATSQRLRASAAEFDAPGLHESERPRLRVLLVDGSRSEAQANRAPADA